MWVLGALVGAIQILPMTEYMKQSAAWKFRSQLFSHTVYPPYELISFIVPDFFGTPYDANYLGFSDLVSTACYVGVAPLVLALISLTLIPSQVYVRYFWTISFVCIGIVSYINYRCSGRFPNLPC